MNVEFAKLKLKTWKLWKLTFILVKSTNVTNVENKCKLLQDVKKHINETHKKATMLHLKIDRVNVLAQAKIGKVIENIIVLTIFEVLGGPPH